MDMNILKRMDVFGRREFAIRDRMVADSSDGAASVSDPLRRWSLRGSVTGLSVAGAVHAAWAAGSTWPAASFDELADLVVGVRPFPSVPMTLGVVALIGVGAGLLVNESRRVHAEQWAPVTTLGQVLRFGGWGVPAVLAVRGIGGLAVSALGIGQATAVFRYWDLRFYSPLCVVLALLGALAVWPNRAEAATEVQ